MVATIGLTGLRPDPSRVSRIASPPYDVIKPGTALEKLLEREPSSLFHIILGPEPAAARDRLLADGSLIEDAEPAYYVYEQTWEDGRRTGVFVGGRGFPVRGQADHSSREDVRRQGQGSHCNAARYRSTHRAGVRSDSGADRIDSGSGETGDGSDLRLHQQLRRFQRARRHSEQGLACARGERDGARAPGRARYRALLHRRRPPSLPREPLERADSFPLLRHRGGRHSGVQPRHQWRSSLL